MVVTITVLAGLVVPRPAGATAGGDVVDIDIVQPSEGTAGVYITHASGWVEARDQLPHLGDNPPLEPGEKLIGLSALPQADGYWLFTDRGRVFTYGNAPFLGDARDLNLDQPVVSAVATPDGLGYYMVAGDGGIFTYGTARFHGSVPEVLPGVTLRAPVIGIAPSPTGGGYLLVAADGGIFTFGDAVFHGSVPGVLPGVTLDQPVVGVIPEAGGYLMVAADGGIFTFGTARFRGSLGGAGFEGVVAVDSMADGSGYIMIDSVGYTIPFGATEYLAQMVYRGVGEQYIGIRKPAPGVNLLRYTVYGPGRFDIGQISVDNRGLGGVIRLDRVDARSGVTLLDGPLRMGYPEESGFLLVYADQGVHWTIGIQTLAHAPVLARNQTFSAIGPEVFFLPPSESDSALTITVDARPETDAYYTNTDIWWFPTDDHGGLAARIQGPGTTRGTVDSRSGLMIVDSIAAGWTLTIGP